MSTLTSAEVFAAANVRLPKGERTPEQEFVSTALKWASAWRHANQGRVEKATFVSPTALVLSESPALEAELWAQHFGSVAKRIYSSGYDLEPGAVVLASGNLKAMYAVAPPAASESEAIGQLISFEAETEGRAFVLQFPMQGRAAVHYPGTGIDDCIQVDRCISLGQFKLSDIDSTMVDSLLREFHTRAVSTPSAYAGKHLWSDRNAYLLCRDAERFIQGALMTYLCGIFSSTSIIPDWEVLTSGGRADVRLLRPSANGIPQISTFFELKVLRKTRSDKRNAAWVLCGVRQADSYRDEHTDLTYTCAYDARKSAKDLLPATTSYATSKNVELRFYRLSPSLEHDSVSAS